MKAEQSLKECLDGRKKTLGIQHHDTLATMRDLAFLYYKQGRSEAEKLFQEYINHENVIAGTDDHFLSRIHVLYDLGTFFLEQGKLDDAYRLLHECVDKGRKNQGPDHPSTLQTMYQLGRCLYKAKNYEDAEDYLQDCYHLRCEVLGPRHNDTIQVLKVLCDFYANANSIHLIGNREQATQPHVNPHTHAHGNGNNSTGAGGAGHTGLSGGSGGGNKITKQSALELFQEYTDVCKQHYGDDHHETLMTKRGLALNLSHRHLFQKAHPIYLDLYHKRQQLLGDNHRDTMQSMHDLVNSFADLGDYKDAAFLGKKAVDLLTSVKGSNHPETLQAIHNLERVSLSPRK